MKEPYKLIDHDPFEGSATEPETANPAPVQGGLQGTTPETKKEPAPKKPESEKKPAAKRGTPIAANGKIINNNDYGDPSPFPEWPNSIGDDQFIPDEELDFSDLSNLNREINRARSRSFRVKNALTVARREETEAQETYRRSYNRALIGLSGGSVETRKANAEVQTEELYSDVLVSQTVVKELTNLSYTVSRDLDTLKTISDNLRKQLTIGI